MRCLSPLVIYAGIIFTDGIFTDGLLFFENMVESRIEDFTGVLTAPNKAQAGESIHLPLLCSDHIVTYGYEMTL